MIVLGAPSMVFSVVEIYGWITSSSGPNIIATAEQNNFSIPPVVIKDLTKHYSREADDALVSFPLGLQVENYRRLKEYVTISIKNSGDLAAKDVRIQMNGRGLAYVEWDDGEVAEVEFNNDIDIGTIEIEKSLSVSAWTETTIGQESNNPLIVHSVGKQPVSFAQSGSSKSLSATVVIALMVGCLGMFVSVVVLAFARRVEGHFERTVANLEREKGQVPVGVVPPEK